MSGWKSLIYAGAIALAELLVLALVPLAALGRGIYALLKRQRLSVWTGTPILTLSRKAAAERLLGVRAVSVVRQSYYITNDFSLDLRRAARGNLLVAFALTYATFLGICVAAKRVHTFADGGLLPSRRAREFSAVELMLYRWLGIQHFVWVYGADVRTRAKTQSLGEPNCCTDCTQVRVACVCDEAKAGPRMARLSRTAAGIFSMGDMIEYTPGSYNQAFFWPLNLAASQGERYRPEFPAADAGRPLRVVHAPNHRMFKGTRHLQAAVQQLREEGVPIELVLVENVPNAQALEIYRTADIVFDQCLIGFHGYFALEAMALGKPVMCFIRDPARYLLAPEECPLINIQVATLAQTLRHYAQQGRASLPDIGQRGRAYVERYYTEQAFSARLGTAYEALGVRA